MSAAVSNLNNKNASMLESSINYGGLTDANIEILHELAKHNAMSMIKTLNRRAAELMAAQAESEKRARRESDKSKQRINFGVFFYHANDDLAEPNQANANKIIPKKHAK